MALKLVRLNMGTPQPRALDAEVQAQLEALAANLAALQSSHEQLTLRARQLEADNAAAKAAFERTAEAATENAIAPAVLTAAAPSVPQPAESRGWLAKTKTAFSQWLTAKSVPES